MERVLVWGRSAAHARATAARLVAEGLPAEACGDLAAGLALADIVTCATTAREPIVRGALVRPGTHVDLVGAFTPEMRESDDALVQRAEVFVDTFAGALKEAGDLVQPIGCGRDRARARPRRARRSGARAPPGPRRGRGGDALQVGGHRAGGSVRGAARVRPGAALAARRRSCGFPRALGEEPGCRVERPVLQRDDRERPRGRRQVDRQALQVVVLGLELQDDARGHR